MDVASYDLLATGVLLLDGQGIVEHANTTAEELFGLSRRQLLGLPGYSLFNADAALQSRFLGAIQGRFGVLRQDLAISRLGEVVPVSLTLVPLHDQDWAALLEVQAIERHILLDRNQHLVNELDAQRESLRNLAHEIKNPLGGIRGAAQLLEAEFEAGSGLHEYTGVMIAEADRLSSLVDRLIAPQGETLRKARFNIHEICERVYTLVRAEFEGKIEFVRDYDASAPELLGDSPRLLQALLNIARNAAQALTEEPATPHARLAMRTRIGRRLALGGQSVKMGIIVAIIDNGPGIPKLLLDKVFHPLVTGRAGGTGLGLSLAQEFVQQHGGALEFDSCPGCTEFRMILPLEPA
jgi:two-component system nitrogen regulation sensor histidine kinase GlnL